MVVVLLILSPSASCAGSCAVFEFSVRVRKTNAATGSQPEQDRPHSFRQSPLSGLGKRFAVPRTIRWASSAVVGSIAWQGGPHPDGGSPESGV